MFEKLGNRTAMEQVKQGSLPQRMTAREDSGKQLAYRPMKDGTATPGSRKDPY